MYILIHTYTEIQTYIEFALCVIDIESSHKFTNACKLMSYKLKSLWGFGGSNPEYYIVDAGLQSLSSIFHHNIRY